MRTRFRVVGCFLLVAAWLVAGARVVDAGWLIYHKPEFKGTVVDSETWQPIEGAIVVAMYTKDVISIPESRNVKFHFQEVITGKDGLFRIPAYTTLVNPFAWDGGVFFVVYKSGYAAVPGLILEDVLTDHSPKYAGTNTPWAYNKKAVFKFQPGIIGLPKLDSKWEIQINTSTVNMCPREAAPLLYQVIDEDRRMN